MARIIGGIAASHTPTIGFAVDRDQRSDPVWAPIFDAFAPVQRWIAEKQPDVLLMIYNDHVTSFFFDHYSAFTLGVGERWAVADEGGGARALPAIAGHPALAAHLGQSLMADEFDMSFFQDKALDHGCFSPLSVMCPHEAGWPVKLVPLQMGVLQFPVPSARRCWKLGQALRRAIESFPEDLAVAVVATGGLSHQVHGERAGFNNPEWDARFLDLFERDPEQLTQMTQADYATLGGWEGAEVIMWLVMRGALAAQVTCLHRSYYLPSMTGIATAIYEPVEQAAHPLQAQRQRAHIGAQTAGAEDLPGTYPFTLLRGVQAYRLNRFLHGMIEPRLRERFLADEAHCMHEAGLSDEECDLLRRRDWRGLIRYGVIFFLLEKLGAVVGVSNLHIYAAMRGQSLADFQQTRNAPGAMYSVAAKPAAPLAWEPATAPQPTSEHSLSERSTTGDTLDTLTHLAAPTLAAFTLLCGSHALAQAPAWPAKPVRILTPFPAGAGPEAVVRLLAEKLQKKWGQPVIVENKPGANGFIAIDSFKRGNTEGYDLIQLDNVHLVAYPHLFKKLPYDPVKDFEPIAPLFRTYFFVGVPSGSKYKTVGDIVADAKAHPGALNYGSWSVGNPVHLGSAMLESMTGTEMQHVIYKETSMLYTGVANGELNFALGSLATAGPMQRAGKIRFIATTAPKRLATFPEVPTVAESGGPANYEVTGWTTIAAPRGLPKAVADKIQKDVEAALAEPDLKERYATFGYDAFPVTREQFSAFISAESTKYAEVIKRAKVSLD